MNFYSLDGSKVDNDLFQNKQIFERFDNSSNENDSEESKEEFAGAVPTTISSATDLNYQCSDNFSVSGNTLGSVMSNSNLNSCKTECMNNGSNCIGFNFDTSTNTCTLKQNASSLNNSSQNNTLCIKKSAGNKGCKVKKNPMKNEAAFNELNSIFKNNSENIQEKISVALNNPSHKTLSEMIKNYYNMPQSEQTTLTNQLSNATNIPSESIRSNMPKLMQFVNSEDSPNFDIIATIKMIGAAIQKNMPNEHIMSSPSMSTIPSESEINFADKIKLFQNLNPNEQSMLINTLSNFSGVAPEIVKSNIPAVTSSVMSTDVLNTNGIYQQVKNLAQNTITENRPAYPLAIPKIETLTKSELYSEMEGKNQVGNMGNNPDGVYVDLDCFMNNIDVLKNHTDNMLIDLSLLTSNIKSCSYVKKNTISNTLPTFNRNNSEAERIVNEITSKIEIPQPGVVKLQNLQANVLISTPNERSPAQYLEIVKEPFESDSNYNWSYSDFFKIVLILIILALLIFRK